MPATPLYCACPHRLDAARLLSQRFALPLLEQRPQQGYWLELGEERLELLTTGKHGAVYAEFVEGAAKHRREQGGGRGQPVAKAIGLKGAKELPYVVDATAGLGRDSFVLAGLGCRVTLVERSPVAAALLADALERAAGHPDTADIAARMQLVHASSIAWLAALDEAERPDVVFVDPMFPDTDKKSAAAKKDMQAFQQVIGDDQDSAALLQAAIAAAKNRVVVKRPRLGAAIEGVKPSAVLDGKSTRFDLYVIKALNPALG
ncbi:class I SAM-dependent methyltransferase [Chromobacterium haemolyticum]|uniref:class I SAM-dependent methyltransferase n=1 Tax=Chromobacterium TaxID=535 RepID=UPI0018880140|nr:MULTISPECIES: class I SAM-dependent methyltransferase [Chromobacterium]QOZ81928.1 16S rRNA methyltransferase [Chromobacterium sp. Rain0013]WON81927.1 class I SAM-dependent methyltransferase [Chromobacterium haemolyticum]